MEFKLNLSGDEMEKMELKLNLSDDAEKNTAKV